MASSNTLTRRPYASGSLYRTFSSPDLRDSNQPYTRYLYDNSSPLEEDAEFYVIGDRILVDGHRLGSVAYFGELHYATGDWVGVVLDEPSGQHSGKVHGREYFQCAPMHGLMVRPSRVTRVLHSARNSPSVQPSSSSILANDERRWTSTTSKSPGRLTSESPYYYDDDYRLAHKPTVESLERQLKSLGSGYQRDHQDTPTSSQRLQGILKNGQQSGLRRNNRPSSLSRSFGSPIHKHDGFRNSFRPQREPLSKATPAEPPADHYDNVSNLSTNSRARRLNIGDRVVVKSSSIGNMELFGTLRYLGDTEFATGEWAGVELDQSSGLNDGSVFGVRYFRCSDNFGLFVPASRCRRVGQPESEIFTTVRSTIKSPPPNTTTSTTTTTTHRPSRFWDTSGYGSHSSNSPSLASSSYSPIEQTNARHSSSGSQSISSSPQAYTRDSPNSTRFLSHHGSAGNHFADNDLDRQIKRLIHSPTKSSNNLFDRVDHRSYPRAKSVMYTFKSSKYDGNPIAVKSVEYDR